MKPETKRKLSRDKKQIVALISATVFILIGIAAFIIGYAIRDGWAAVAAWFGSKWAIYVYVGAIVYIAFMVMFFIYKKFRRY